MDAEGRIDAAAATAALRALEMSVLNLKNVVVAQRDAMLRIGAEQRTVGKITWANLLVGALCLVCMCMVLYKQS